MITETGLVAAATILIVSCCAIIICSLCKNKIQRKFCGWCKVPESIKTMGLRGIPGVKQLYLVTGTDEYVEFPVKLSIHRVRGNKLFFQGGRYYASASCGGSSFATSPTNNGIWEESMSTFIIPQGEQVIEFRVVRQGMRKTIVGTGKIRVDKYIDACKNEDGSLLPFKANRLAIILQDLKRGSTSAELVVSLQPMIQVDKYYGTRSTNEKVPDFSILFENNKNPIPLTQLSLSQLDFEEQIRRSWPQNVPFPLRTLSPAEVFEIIVLSISGHCVTEINKKERKQNRFYVYFKRFYDREILKNPSKESSSSENKKLYLCWAKDKPEGDESYPDSFIACSKLVGVKLISEFGGHNDFVVYYTKANSDKNKFSSLYFRTLDLNANTWVEGIKHIIKIFESTRKPKTPDKSVDGHTTSESM